MNVKKSAPRVAAKKLKSVVGIGARTISPAIAVKRYFLSKPAAASDQPIRITDTASGRGLVKFKAGSKSSAAKKAG